MQSGRHFYIGAAVIQGSVFIQLQPCKPGQSRASRLVIKRIVNEILTCNKKEYKIIIVTIRNRLNKL